MEAVTLATCWNERIEERAVEKRQTVGIICPNVGLRRGPGLSFSAIGFASVRSSARSALGLADVFNDEVSAPSRRGAQPVLAELRSLLGPPQ